MALKLLPSGELAEGAETLMVTLRGGENVVAPSPALALSLVGGERLQVASAQTVVLFLTTGTSWTVPGNFNAANNTIEAIGGGGGGANALAGTRGGGGGGGGTDDTTDGNGAAGIQGIIVITYGP